MKRTLREFKMFDTSNPMTVDIAHIYGLQYMVQTFGDKNVIGTNIYFDFGLIIFVAEDYQTLKEEIFGEESGLGGYPVIQTPPPTPPASVAN